MIPLPPAKAMTSPACVRRPNTPAGKVASTAAPGTSESSIQLETTPSAIRLTVTCSWSSTVGAEDIE